MHSDSNPNPNAAPVRIAILAKAPLAGFAKTRLVPALGTHGAARLQRAFILRTMHVAQQAGLGGGVQLWCAPDADQRFFRALQCTTGVDCRDQPTGNLGQRMQAAIAAAPGPVLLVGTDCPALGVQHLRAAAAALQVGEGAETDADTDKSKSARAVFIPAEDGGYVLIGLRRALPRVFQRVDWSTPRVMAQTRERLTASGARWVELPTLWDVDEPQDWQRWQAMRHHAAPVACRLR